MPIEFVRGNMFDRGYDYRVNTVNCVGVMGKGIALEFKKRYPDMFQEYRNLCKQGKIWPGILHIYKDIINFPTKKHWRNPSEYSWIKDGLLALKQYLSNNCQKETRVAMPPLGCANGGLDWSIVKGMITEHLHDVDASIDIYEP